ncbi:hypothetical protein OGAPHI_000171 [Ogataea philodendri]|uniref:Uncharacterized protein n=1 Tax=Ogataea philodendri TaxID=1378263 RepID=A0A9P8PHZ4_9ASCO|nr:uncharacterized protein OGAPHI_000171 [Ogataea philodendri]KAH3671985.1 hypothetical protein OGAPHI_000171 [Ogataea philodendri]
MALLPSNFSASARSLVSVSAWLTCTGTASELENSPASLTFPINFSRDWCLKVLVSTRSINSESKLKASFILSIANSIDSLLSSGISFCSKERFKKSVTRTEISFGV